MPLLKEYPQLEVIQKIARQKKIEIHLVGGFLRDFVVERKKSDFDFAIEKNAVPFAKNFSKKIKGTFVLLDDEHGCGRVVKKLKNGILTFDFADFRAKTFKGDLSHRDFTINTLSVNLSEIDKNSEISNLIKDQKKGLKDIKDKRIRMTSPRVFVEDPLRILRAFSLKAELNFKIEKQTLQQIKKDRMLLRDVSYERIRDEVFKILNTDRAGKILKEMDKAGLIELIIPQVRIMFGCRQGTYHHLDVWPHSLETVMQLDKIISNFKNEKEVYQYLSQITASTRTRASIIKLAALLHDIGKPETRKREQGRISFHGHENAGKNICKHIAKLLKLSTRERYILCDMVQLHLRPGYLSNFKIPSARMIYRFFRDSKKEAVSILLLSLADQRSTRGPFTTQEDQKHHEEICLGLIKRYFEKQKEKPFIRLVNGNDVMKYLKMNPGPLIGKILKEIEEAQNLGKIKSKKEALELAKTIVDK